MADPQSLTVASWEEATLRIHEYAQKHGNPRILHGTGNAVREPCVVYSCLDALSGEGRGYFVRHYPEGEGCSKPCRYFYVRIVSP